MLGPLALGAALGAFAFATQDIVIDAWRIEVADEKTPIDLLSTIYQLGYRTAALVGGAGALLLATILGWPGVFAVGALLMGVGIIGTLIAPEPEATSRAAVARERIGSPRLRLAVLCRHAGGLWRGPPSCWSNFMIHRPDHLSAPTRASSPPIGAPWIVCGHRHPCPPAWPA